MSLDLQLIKDLVAADDARHNKTKPKWFDGYNWHESDKPLTNEAVGGFVGRARTPRKYVAPPANVIAYKA